MRKLARPVQRNEADLSCGQSQGVSPELVQILADMVEAALGRRDGQTPGGVELGQQTTQSDEA